MTPTPIYFDRFSILNSGIFYHFYLLFIFSICIGITSVNAAAMKSLSLDSCTDTEKPVITIDIGSCNSAVFDSILKTCTGLLSIKASANDDETPADLLSFEYKIDLYNDGKGIFNGFDCQVGPLTYQEYKTGIVPVFHQNIFSNDSKNAFDATGTYPIGIHKICWYVKDTCGNMAVHCQLFEIKDCNAPIVSCTGGLQTFTLPQMGCITLYAKDFNIGSYDNCTASGKLLYYFNGDPAKTNLTICCEDFIASGACDDLLFDVQVWVQDEEGNSDYSSIPILVEDVFNVCPDGDSFTLYGQINSVIHEKTTFLTKDVETNLFKYNNVKKQTNGNPFRFKCLGGFNDIEMIKSNDSLNSVNTYDLYMIQKQINHIDTFTNFYQYVTADVDQNGITEIEDYVEIKRLILGVENQFKKSRAWKILPVRYDTSNLFTTMEKYHFRITWYYQTIIARCFKMGDVNDFVSPLNYVPLKTGTTDSLVFIYKNQQILKGDKVKIDYYAQRFNSVTGFQGTIKFDNQKLRYQNSISGSLTIDSACLGSKFISNGLLTISWNDLYPISCSPDSILFSLEFEALQDGDLCEAISFTSDLTPAEAYTDSVLIKKIRMESCDDILKNKEVQTDDIRIFPNPMKNVLNFDFPEETAFPIRLDFYSNEGKTIRTFTIPIQTRQFSCELKDMPSGLFFVKLSSGNEVIFRKCIKTE